MDEFEIFGETEGAMPGGLEELLSLINHSIEEHDMPIAQAISMVNDMMNPGHSDESHDVRPMFAGALFALGYGHLVESFGSLYLNTMPWGIGFSVGVKPGFEFSGLPADAQRAVMKALTAVLQVGGLTAKLSDDNTILVRKPGSEEPVSMDIDALVGQFRQEIETELGPTIDPADPWQRWLPK